MEKKDILKEFGRNLKAERNRAGLSQEQLAEMIDKNLAFIGAVEAPNVNRTVSLDTLFDIAAALDVPPYKFLIEDD